MNYSYLFVDNLNGHPYENGLDELKASIISLRKNQNYDSIQVFNNESQGRNIEYFKKENIIHNHISLSKNYGGSDNINPINILVEKIICLMNFDQNQDITLIDIDTEFQKSIPDSFWNQNYIVFDNVEYPIMAWRNLDKVLPSIPWKTFDVNFDNSFLMYNTGVIHLPKKFRKELCEKALTIVDYLNNNFSPEERCGNKLDEQIALSIVCHDVYGRFGNIKYSKDYIHHHWESKQTGIKWWEKYDLSREESKYETFISMHSQSCLDLVLNYSDNLKDKVIIDVGSNIGLFAKSIAENVSYKHIHLFEPSLEYFNHSKILLKDFKNISYNNFALGNCKEEKILYKSKNSNLGWNTLYEKDPNQDQNFFEMMESEIVSTVRLDDYYKDIKQIDFIKIDVEGYERNVLEGSWKLIKKFKPNILIEVGWGINHPDWDLNKETYEKLFSLGYEKIDLDSIQNTQDILFKPIESINLTFGSYKLPVSIGILSWKSGQTLRNTLDSYKKNGLLDMVNDVTIFFQEVSDEDRKISKEYDIPFIGYEENIGIGNAFIKLCEISRSSNILLLEHDWQLIEDKEVTFDRLKSGIELLDSGCSVVRYRHRKNPGYPLYTQSAYQGNELNHYDETIKLTSPHLMDCIHWTEHPDVDYSDKISKQGEYFLSTSRWSNFTNNPCMYKKDFYINTVFPFKQIKEKSTEYYKNFGENLDHYGSIEPWKHSLEVDIGYWWSRQNFKVAWGEGLFTHNDIQKYTQNNFEVLEHHQNTISIISPHRESDLWSPPISVLNEFKRLGWSAKIYTLFDSNDNYVDDNIYELLKTNPDIIMHMDWGQHTSPILSELKKTGAYCIMESGDDPQKFDINKIKAPWFDLILSPDIRCVKEYKEMGYDAEWWTHFSDTNVYFPLDEQPTYVAVCSRGMGNNAYIIDSLAQRYPDQIKNQNGFHGSEHNKFLNSANIILQQSRYGEITRRIFEGMSCKKLVLADKLEPSTFIQDLFVDGEDIVFYEGEEDCLNKVVYYSNNQEEAKKIAESGYQKVLNNHTQIQRVEFIINKWKSVVK